MTDGPFKNATLPPRWKRYGEALACDASSPKELTQLACHNMLADIDMKRLAPLLKDLNEYAQRSQSHPELFPSLTIDAIFSKHDITPPMFNLQRNLTVNIAEKMTVEKALTGAVNSFVSEWMEGCKNRMNEALLGASSRGEMSRANCLKYMQVNEGAIANASRSEFGDVLRTGNKQAYKSVLQKKTGADVGPE